MLFKTWNEKCKLVQMGLWSSKELSYIHNYIKHNDILWNLIEFLMRPKFVLLDISWHKKSKIEDKIVIFASFFHST